MVKVVVTGAGALLGQGIIRSLQKASMPIEIVALDPSELAVGLYWADRWYRVPLACASDYLERIREILEIERPDAVMIGTDVELAIFSKERDSLERDYGTKILVSSPDVIEIADDKWLTNCLLRENGFAYPESCLPGQEQDLIERVGFPLIVKPRRGARGIGVLQVRDRPELEAALAEQSDLIIQECVSDADGEYTAGVLCFDGVCRASIVMRRDLRDGNTYRAYVDEYPALNAQIRRVTETLRPYGPANFQFRLDKGVVKVFEINGRFSGTTPFRVLAGFNEVEMALRHILWNEPVTQPTIEKMTILRYFTELVAPISVEDRDASMALG